MRTLFALGSIAAFSIAAAGSLAGEQMKLDLVKDGVPSASIVIAKDADKAAKFAALELQSHIRTITGATLPIITDDKPLDGNLLLVGASSAAEKLGFKGGAFKSQEYMIKAVLPSTVILMGKDKNDKGELLYDYMSNPGSAINTWPSIFDEIGSMYAVYDFLRDCCGVKWLNPTDAGTITPSAETLQVSVSEIRRKPFMDYREACGNNSENLNSGGGNWRAGSDGAEKFNAIAYAKNAEAFKDKHLNAMARRAQNRLFQYRMKDGGEKSHCNHSLYNYYERFLDKGHKNFEGYHPEYFAQGYEGQPPQLCYSNPGTVEQIVKDARDYFDQGGYTKPMCGIGSPGYQWGERFFAIEPMDNSSFCKCEACAKQYEPSRAAESSQHSTYWFRFINKVAAELKKSHPDKRISTLAYGTREGLPAGLKLEDNVVVHFCISGNRMPYSPLLKKQEARLREWSEKEDVPMYLWLYNTFPVEIANNGKFHCFPGFFAHEAKRQFDLFKQLDIRGIFHCGFNGEVENYVTYRLMDNPDLPIEPLLDEYFAQFGPAGKPLRQMYELIERRYCDQANYPKGGGGEPFDGHQTVGVAWEHLGNAETMASLQALMEEAEKAASTDIEKKRVQAWKEAVWNYMKAGRESYVERMNAPVPDVKAPRVAEAGGDPGKADWSKASPLGDKWFKRGGDQPSAMKLGGRICHDGNYLYLELVDNIDPKKLTTSPMIACYDDWEIVLALQKAQPFRQYLVGPSAMTEALSYGELNWRQGVSAKEHGGEKSFGLKADSDTSGDKWTLRLAFPLKTMSDRPVKPGDTVYLNIMRVGGPNSCGESPYGIYTWVSHTTVKDVDRLGKVTLE